MLGRFAQKCKPQTFRKLAIFDLEGIFISTSGRHTALTKLFELEKIYLTDTQISRYAGFAKKEVIHRLGKHHGLSNDSIRTLQDLYPELQASQFKICNKSVELLPFSKYALDRIKEISCFTCLTSGFDHRSFNEIYGKLLNQGIFFDLACCQSDFAKRKDMIEYAMKATKVDNACFIADTCVDMCVGANIVNKQGNRCVTTVGIHHFSAEGPNALTKLVNSAADFILPTMENVPLLDYFDE
jgi:hypothetical protein